MNTKVTKKILFLHWYFKENKQHIVVDKLMITIMVVTIMISHKLFPIT